MIIYMGMMTSNNCHHWVGEKQRLLDESYGNCHPLQLGIPGLVHVRDLAKDRHL